MSQIYNSNLLVFVCIPLLSVSCKEFAVLVKWYKLVSVLSIAKVYVKLWIFSYRAVQTYDFGAQKNPLMETVLFSTYTICLG